MLLFFLLFRVWFKVLLIWELGFALFVKNPPRGWVEMSGNPKFGVDRVTRMKKQTQKQRKTKLSQQRTLTEGVWNSR